VSSIRSPTHGLLSLPVGLVFNNALPGFVYHGDDIDSIKTDPRVKSVIRDSVVTLDDPTFDAMTLSESNITSTISVPEPIQYTGIKRIFAHNKPYMLKASDTCRCDAVVAVVDTGVSFSHSALNVNKAKSVDCSLFDPFDPSSQATCIQGLGDDQGGHGTHVAGIICAMPNSFGVLGVCPGAEIWAIKVFRSSGGAYLSWIFAGLDYVASQGSTIDVVNLSIGGEGCLPLYCDVLENVKKAGVAITVSAGNKNSLASSQRPACCSAGLSEFIVTILIVACILISESF
jgi:subtilisin family serine protease